VAGPLDDAGWKRLLAADNAWGIAAKFWIAFGLARVFYGGKTPAFYWHNGFFWVKLALFGAVFLLELAPMTTFMRVRRARRKGMTAPHFPIDAYRRINVVELALIVTIVFVAAFMSRGIRSRVRAGNVTSQRCLSSFSIIWTCTPSGSITWNPNCPSLRASEPRPFTRPSARPDRNGSFQTRNGQLRRLVRLSVTSRGTCPMPI